jgi:hypothetical protein
MAFICLAFRGRYCRFIAESRCHFFNLDRFIFQDVLCSYAAQNECRWELFFKNPIAFRPVQCIGTMSSGDRIRYRCKYAPKIKEEKKALIHEPLKMFLGFL